MAETTVYDVMVKYQAGGAATSELGSMGAAAAAAERNMQGLKGTLMTIGSFALGAGGLMGAKKAFIDFNSSVEQSKLSMAAVNQMFSGQSFAQSQGVAEQFFTNYQKAAQASTATTEDFLEAHKALAPSLMQAGASTKAIQDVVQGMVIAAPTLGFKPEMAQLDVRSMLSGTVSNRDLFAKMLLQSVGQGVEEFNEKAKKDPKFALNIVSKALTQETFKDTARAMEGSFAGVVSTLQDTLQLLGGVVGKPIFGVITAEVSKLNSFIAKNSDEIDRLAKAFGGGLVSGFQSVAAFMKILGENKESLIAIAGVYAGFKGIGGVAGAVGSLQAGIVSLSSTSVAASTGLAGAASAAATFAGAVGIAYVALQALASHVDTRQANSIKDDAGYTPLLQDRLKKMDSSAYDRDAFFQSQTAMIKQVNESGALDAYGKLNEKAFFSFMAERNKGTMGPDDVQAITTTVADMIAKAGPELIRQTLEKKQVAQAPWSMQADSLMRAEPGDKRETKKPAAVSVNIHRIEVASDDPDRFAMQLVGSFRRAAERPTESSFSLPRGD